ncbi:MAG TPA: glycosyltransferase family 2 protein [Pyrinomonadaceae bacterium]|nr:glycosyltransferase family 2 protein [Pyrinomonadaceae bacterium]
MAKISLIIATHNRPKLLVRAVNSAYAAGADDLEIVVVDDASTAETYEACKSFSNVHYVRLDRRQGSGGARNLGLVVSRSEYVTFLDDDDSRLPCSLGQQSNLLDQEPEVGMVYGRALLVDNNCEQAYASYPAVLFQGDIFWKLLTRNFIPCGSALFRRSCLSKVGLMADDAFGMEDWDLWVRIAEMFPILAVDSPIYSYRTPRPGSDQFTTHASRVVQHCTRLFHNWLKLPRCRRLSKSFRQKLWIDFSAGMGAHLLGDSWNALRRGHLINALKNLTVCPRLHALALPEVIGCKLLGIPRKSRSWDFDTQSTTGSADGF